MYFTSHVFLVYSMSPDRPDGLWGPLNRLLNGYQATFPAVKRPGLDVGHPYGAAAMNK